MGQTYSYALRTTLSWGGINPFWFLGDTLVGSYAFTIDDPMRDYMSVPYDPETGVGYMDFYRQLCEVGVRAEAKAYLQYGSYVQPFILFRPDLDSDLNLTPTNAFVGQTPTTPQIDVGDVQTTIDLANKPNFVICVGRTVDGYQIFAYAPAVPVDNVGSYLHAGTARLEIFHKPDLMFYYQCLRVAVYKWYYSVRPRLIATIHTIDPNVSGMWVRDVVSVKFNSSIATNYGSVALLYKVQDLKVTHTRDHYIADVEVADLWILPPGSTA